MTVSFEEMAGSPIETFGPEGMRAERKLMVAFEDRYTLIAELLGDGFAFGGSGYADFPGREGVVAIRTKMEPFNPLADDGTFTDVTTDRNTWATRRTLLTVNYEVLRSGDPPSPPDIEDGTFLTYRRTFNSDFMEMKGRSLRWLVSEEKVAADIQQHIRVPVLEHHLTWHRVVRPPWEDIRDKHGTVNASAFLGLPAETVLFAGAGADREFYGFDGLSDMEFGWRMSYTFIERNIKSFVTADETIGWNHTWRSRPAGSPGWDKLVDAIAFPNLPYATTSFDSLFKFAAVAE